MVAKKPTGVKSVTLGDVRTAQAATGVKAAPSTQGGVIPPGDDIEKLDKDVKDYDDQAKEADKQAKQVDKDVKKAESKINKGR